MTPATAADTRLVHTVGVGALEWLYEHRDGFRLEQDADPETGFLERFKPVGELAVICKVLFREGVAGSRQADLARKLLDHAWRDVLDGGRMLVRGQRGEPMSPIPFEVYVPFRELGYSQPELEDAIRLNHRLASWAGLEVVPVRRLGLGAFERRFGLPPSLPEDEAFSRTWLGRAPEPWTVDARIGYDITHTVFHLTDWGENRGGLPSPVADHLALWLPVWLDDWLDLKRWDLLGELLVVDACLPRPTLDAAAWEGLAGAQQPDGAMPALGPMPDGDPEDVFDVVYHPTLVAAFASVLATSRALERLSAEASG
ncbi:hypothetical protein E2C00_03170 [Streptomyces sp. WAC05374]|uniref:DUF6895 family protein n=1 Tax=Streptomyces sp. WAC05374 TaxID=2487420 RepID=UPI000F89AB96|nr:hypothetical protein [Streptomyces sp. WAC05374]RST02727.1 hypothetical protein EF905_34580 [Streptomyces sp. WAC05374]TDF50500.1 hypothetical protein E2B92_03150 [Streptomyces sp. WAC05374]TDF51868.1 hypothetical protein E2C02_23335 [Streptomyces sp. WAC05374]TDF60754.1 hypothetical protein E2C00_03170 [Streptomyces sp. WAC05374]